MDEFTHGGTPPTLWGRDRYGKKPWTGSGKGMKGLVRDQVRIKKLCDQVEKLSWMLELMDQEPGINLEGADYQWQHTHERIA